MAGVPVFAVFVSFWALLMLEKWKRKQAVLALEWGTSSFEDEELDRPEFEGSMRPSLVDGKERMFFAEEKRHELEGQSTRVVMTLIVLVCIVVASIFALRWFLVNGVGRWGVTYGPPIASLANGVTIEVLNQAYKAVAVGLTDRENHRTDTMYEDSLVGKLFMFEFVNSFASFYYLAFAKRAVDGCDPSPQGHPSCMYALQINLVTIFFVKLATNQVKGIVMPLLKLKRENAAEAQAAADRGVERTDAEVQMVLETRDEMLSVMDDYKELAIQFGFTSIFVTAFPLAPALAFASNYIEIRGDAYKCLKVCQRYVWCYCYYYHAPLLLLLLLPRFHCSLVS